MKENINALDEINKGANMGVDAIGFILEKVEDNKFRKVLEKQSEQYKEIEEKVSKIYSKYNSEDKPHETNAMEKIMTWYGVEMKTFNNKSTSKIAELLLKGTNMGIIEGRKIYNNKNVNDEVLKIVDDYIKMQEKYVEVLKKYL